MNTATRQLQTDTDLGGITHLMRYMRLKETYLHALKRCANERHSKTNPTCFTGNMSCKQWIMEWLRNPANRDFKITLVYPKKPHQIANQPARSG